MHDFEIINDEVNVFFYYQCVEKELKISSENYNGEKATNYNCFIKKVL